MNSHFLFLKFVMDNYNRNEYSDGSIEWSDKKGKHVFTEEQIWEAWKQYRKTIKA